MEKLNEIKKALYKEKPIAEAQCEDNVSKKYSARLENGEDVEFIVPFSDMGETEFSDNYPAQLLIRWINL